MWEDLFHLLQAVGVCYFCGYIVSASHRAPPGRLARCASLKMSSADGLWGWSYQGILSHCPEPQVTLEYDGSLYFCLEGAAVFLNFPLFSVFCRDWADYKDQPLSPGLSRLGCCFLQRAVCQHQLKVLRRAPKDHCAKHFSTNHSHYWIFNARLETSLGSPGKARDILPHCCE